MSDQHRKRFRKQNGVSDFEAYHSEMASEKQVGRIDIGRHLGRSDMVLLGVGNSGYRVYRSGRFARIVQSEEYSAPTTSLASIQRHLPPSRHPVPSRETIRRRLTEVGLRSRNTTDPTS
ncbi:hypothetical protein TNCV_4339801 [Trichonephila clavipes]|nr:hypothetical protein TNCV_4339801 [Trichonephila clavipes]